MKKFETFEEAFQEVLKMPLEELEKIEVDPGLVDVFATFEMMDECVQEVMKNKEDKKC